MQRSNRDTALIVLGVIAAVATAATVYFALQARRNASKAQLAEQELSKATHELASSREQLVTANSSALPTASVQSGAAPKLSPSIRTNAESSPLPSASADFRAAFNSPAMRERIRQDNLTRLRPIYDPLLTQLNLSLEDRERFYDLQVRFDDPIISLDKAPSEARTPEERAQIENQISAARATALQQINNLLGSQGYQMYEGYRATQSERMLIQQFRQQADPRSPQISDWQYDRLRDLLIEARSQFPPAGDDYSASYAATLRQAAQILTPDQFASFKKYLQSQEDLESAMRKLAPQPR